MTEIPVGNAVRSRSHSVRVAAFVALATVLAVAGFVGYRSVSAKRLATSQLSSATTLIEDADRMVASVDEVVGAQAESGQEARAREAEGEAEAAKAKLDQAVEILRGTLPRLSDGERARARLLAEAASARLDMLAQAPAILTFTAKAARSLPKAEAAWDSVLEADRLSDRSVAEYNKLTKKGVEASSRLNKQAAAKLSTAREGFLAAESAFPESRLEVYVAYVDALIALNKLSRRSDSAWLSGDVDKANDLIGTYNAQDKRAVAQAKTLPASPASAIASAYESATQDASEKYYSARERATKADAELQGK